MTSGKRCQRKVPSPRWKRREELTEKHFCSAGGTRRGAAGCPEAHSQLIGVGVGVGVLSPAPPAAASVVLPAGSAICAPGSGCAGEDEGQRGAGERTACVSFSCCTSRTSPRRGSCADSSSSFCPSQSMISCRGTCSFPLWSEKASSRALPQERGQHGGAQGEPGEPAVIPDAGREEPGRGSATNTPKLAASSTDGAALRAPRSVWAVLWVAQGAWLRGCVAGRLPAASVEARDN